MTKRRLGRTGLMVSELGLGGYMFTCDFQVPRKEADAILNCAIESGINYLDTASLYGSGESEELIGRALQRHPDKAIYVSTKVGHLYRTIVHEAGEPAYREEEALHRAIAHSMWLLQRERVEIMMIHEPEWPVWGLDRKTGDAVVMRVLESLKADGRIGAIGLGSWDCELIADLLETGRIDVALVVGGRTLVGRPMNARVLPAAKKHDVGIVLGGPFLQGLLSVMQRERLEGMQKSGQYEEGYNEVRVRRILAIYDLCDEVGMTIAEMGIRYILAEPGIHSVIPGAQKCAYLQENIAATAKGPLPTELVQRIDEINE